MNISYDIPPAGTENHSYDHLKRWISDNGFTHLEVTTVRGDYSTTTVGEIDIVEGDRLAPAQIPHIGIHCDVRSLVVSSPEAWPDQIDAPPFEHPVHINPRITSIVGVRAA